MFSVVRNSGELVLLCFMRLPTHLQKLMDNRNLNNLRFSFLQVQYAVFRVNSFLNCHVSKSIYTTLKCKI